LSLIDAERACGAAALWLAVASGCEPHDSSMDAARKPAPPATVSPPIAAPVTRHVRKRWFEAEIEGTLSGERGDGHRVVFVAAEPCQSESIEKIETVAMVLLGPRFKSGDFSAEAIASEGTRFYLCAFALDREDRLVGFGQYEDNPVVIHANDEPEVEVEDIDIALEKTSPRQLPKGRYRGEG
jgi:hypothetical protein